MEYVRHHIWQREDPLHALKDIRLQRVERGESILDLSMINPDLPPPRVMMDRLIEASMKPGNHRYAVSRGVRKIRDAFVSKYREAFGVTLSPEDEVCVTMGTKDALAELLQVVCAPGDSVLLPSPCYPAHLSLVEYAGLRPLYFPLSSSEEETLEAIHLATTEHQVSAVLLNFPHNPSGITVSARFWSQLRDRMSRRGIFLMNDFVYGELVYRTRYGCSLLSGAATHEGIAETYSLSKAYNVPGWRVGALLGDAQVVKAVAHLKTHIDYGIFLPLQYAATAALLAKEDLVRSTRDTYERRTSLLRSLLISAGCTIAPTEAGCSLWVKLPEGRDGHLITQTLADHEGILIMPGVCFGEAFTQFIRIACVAPDEKLRYVSAELEKILW